MTVRGSTQEEVVRLLDRMRRDGLRLCVAESCTGGLVGARITDVPGASDVFLGGVVAYADAVKTEVLGVDAACIERHGAVSGAVVEAMAHGVRQRFGADVAIAVSGIAGPAGGTEAKPVGTVWIAVLGPEHLLRVQRFVFQGDRQEIRMQATAQAFVLALGEVDEAEQEGVA